MVGGAVVFCRCLGVVVWWCFVGLVWVLWFSVIRGEVFVVVVAA